MICEKCGRELADSEFDLTEDLIKDKSYIDTLEKTFSEESLMFYSKVDGFEDKQIIEVLHSLFSLKIEEYFLRYKMYKEIQKITGLTMEQILGMHIIDNHIYY